MQKPITFILILFLLLTTIPHSQAHTLEGALSGIIDSGSYLVIGNIWVEEYDSLRISPGTRLEFAGHYAFDIYGYANFAGGEDDSIRFIPQSDSIVWSGVHFNDSSDNGSTLSYCLITGSDSAGVTIYNSSPSISNSSIVYNTGYAGGGGIFCYQADPFVSSCNISFNQAYFGGGGVNCYQSGALIENCIIRYNSAVNGGGIYVYQSDNIEILNCFIEYNESADRGGGIQLKNSTTIVDGCEISYNETLNDGGGIDCYNAEPLIMDCTIRENSAHLGGGICNFSSDYPITGTLFTGNWASSGGGLYNDPNSNIIVDQCFFEYNSSSSGSGIFVEQYGNIYIDQTIFRWHYANYGSGIYCANANLDLNCCLFIENEVAYAGAAVFYGNNSQGSIDNCIFYHNMVGSCVGFGNSNTVSVHYSDFFENSPQNFSGSVPPGLEVVNSTNLNGDPCDVYSNMYLNPQFYTLTGDSAYYLSEISPCIDAGNPYDALDPDSTIVDMGRYYYDHGLNTITDLMITIENENVILDWADIANADTYRIYRDFEPAINIFLTDPYDETMISQYTDYGAAGQTGYFYRVTYTLE